jgi:hypothetical protein
LAQAILAQAILAQAILAQAMQIIKHLASSLSLGMAAAVH